jgi:predicted GIY-YIG superfamily endonuclease
VQTKTDMREINWTYCQNNSDKILADGVLKLKACNICQIQDISFTDFGNYLITYKDKPFYIGEAKNIRARLKQQFKPTTSTFYKNFLKTNQAVRSIPIDSFSVRFMPTDIGRKEIEDFGIVNLATALNKFQIGKRLKVDLKKQNGLWDKVQEQKFELLKQGEEIVFKQKFSSWFDTKVKSTAGIYIVMNKTQIIYVGESSDISERHNTHSGTTYFSALRRHIATDILNFELKEKNGKKKYLTDSEDKKVTDYLRGTIATFHPVSFGRYELEEHLIKKHRPLLNRKNNHDD